MGIFFALLSSFFMAIMVIIDKLIIHKIYSNSSNVAVITSSLLGSIIGLALTFFTWSLVASLHPIGTFSLIINATYDIFIWHGLLIFISGFLAITFLKHYFLCFTYDISPTTIASWIATIPMFIFLGIVLTSIFFNTLGIDIKLPSAGFEITFVIGLLLSVFSIILFERVRSDDSRAYTLHWKVIYQIFLLILLGSLYTIITEITLNIKHADYSKEMITLALLPYFWIGFLGGTLRLLRSNRISEAKQVKVILFKYFYVLLLIELVGSLVFFFEYLGISSLNATYIALVIASHIIFVYIAEVLIFNKENKYSLINKFPEIILILMISTGIIMSTVSMLEVAF